MAALCWMFLLLASESKSVLDFKEELRFGGDSGSDGFQWNGANTCLAVDEQGQVYILDTEGRRILCFSPDGKLQFQFGRRGKGPGEFDLPSNFGLLSNGQVVVFENQQGLTFFHFFDRKGKYLKSQTNRPLKLFLQSVSFSPDEKSMASMFLSSDENGEDVWVNTGVLNQALEPLLTLTHDKLDRFDPSKSGESNYWVDFLAQWFRLGGSGIGLVGFSADGGGYTAKSNVFEITAWKPGFKQTRGKIIKAHKPRAQSEEDIELLTEPLREQLLSTLPPDFATIVTDRVVAKALAKANLPMAQSALFGLVATETGVLAISEFDPKTGKSSADYFDGPKYAYRGKVKLPRIQVNLFDMLTGGTTRLLIRKNKAYALLRDEDSDELSFVRYRLITGK